MKIDDCTFTFVSVPLEKCEAACAPCCFRKENGCSLVSLSFKGSEEALSQLETCFQGGYWELTNEESENERN